MTDAYTFAKYYAICSLEPFSPEDVIEAADIRGIRFQDQRAWGSVFTRLSKDGLIKRAGLFARKTSNNSVRPGWVRV